ncbi:MAG: AraC family transcriptional regulator ligand-binding domain-containing protein [Pseudomonadota bacterium]
MTAANRTIRAKFSRNTALGSMASTTVAFALSRGVAIERIEQATGLHRLDLVDPEARIPDDVMPQLWALMEADVPPGTPLSLDMARAAPFSVFGGLAHGAQFAATLRHAIGLLIDNRSVVADRLHVELRETSREVRLNAAHPLDGTDRGRTAEFGLAIAARLLVEILSVEGVIQAIEFSHDALAPYEAYDAYFQVPVAFNQADNAIVFHAEAMSHPVRRSNVEMFAYVEQHFRQVQERLARSQSPTDFHRLKEAVAAMAARGAFNPRLAAAQAHMSLRSAQRLAKAHDTSLRAMTEEARATTAQEMLGDPTIKIETIAGILGYSDDRAFRRAFKRWTGQTPAAFRRAAAS